MPSSSGMSALTGLTPRSPTINGNLQHAGSWRIRGATGRNIGYSRVLDRGLGGEWYVCVGAIFSAFTTVTVTFWIMALSFFLQYPRQ